MNSFKPAFATSFISVMCNKMLNLNAMQVALDTLKESAKFANVKWKHDI